MGKKEKLVAARGYPSVLNFDFFWSLGWGRHTCHFSPRWCLGDTPHNILPYSLASRSVECFIHSYCRHFAVTCMNVCARGRIAKRISWALCLSLQHKLDCFWGSCSATAVVCLFQCRCQILDVHVRTSAGPSEHSSREALTDLKESSSWLLSEPRRPCVSSVLSCLHVSSCSSCRLFPGVIILFLVWTGLESLVHGDECGMFGRGNRGTRRKPAQCHFAGDP
jgi:hypothetical protein